MQRVRLQKGKLLIGTDPYFLREGKILFPEVVGGVMLHRELQLSDAAILLIVQRVLNRRIEPSRCQIDLKAGIDGLWKMLLKPHVQLLHLLRRKTSDRSFNLFDFAYAHKSLRILPARWRIPKFIVLSRGTFVFHNPPFSA